MAKYEIKGGLAPNNHLQNISAPCPPLISKAHVVIRNLNIKGARGIESIIFLKKIDFSLPFNMCITLPVRLTNTKRKKAQKKKQ